MLSLAQVATKRNQLQQINLIQNHQQEVFYLK